MLNGAIHRGRVETAPKDGASVSPNQIAGDLSQFYLESNDGEECCAVDMDSVKAIYIGNNSDSDPLAGIRFFDSAPIPASLWVRIAFCDGEVLEGMIANSWSAFSSPFIRLQLNGQPFGQKEILIPRTSLADLKVITTR